MSGFNWRRGLRAVLMFIAVLVGASGLFVGLTFVFETHPGAALGSLLALGLVAIFIMEARA